MSPGSCLIRKESFSITTLFTPLIRSAHVPSFDSIALCSGRVEQLKVGFGASTSPSPASL